MLLTLKVVLTADAIPDRVLLTTAASILQLKERTIIGQLQYLDTEQLHKFANINGSVRDTIN